MHYSREEQPPSSPPKFYTACPHGKHGDEDTVSPGDHAAPPSPPQSEITGPERLGGEDPNNTGKTSDQSQHTHTTRSRTTHKTT